MVKQRSPKPLMEVRFLLFLFIKKGVFSMFYKIKLFFKNSKKYYPILISDQDYDYNYFFKFMLAKLVSMKEFYESEDSYSTDSEEIANQINICIILLIRIIEDNYSSPECSLYFSQLSESYFSEDKNEVENIRKKINDCLEKNKSELLADKELLFEILNDNILNWWD